MQENWNVFLKSLSPSLRELRTGAPDVMKGFSAIAQSALKPNALDTKTKELIALAISVATRCDDCIGFHAKAAAEQGASREEIMETLGTAIYLGAGPAVMYAAHAISAFDQLGAAGEPKRAQSAEAAPVAG
jgi:AhpD family alkylhydroperoxidase